TRRGFGTIVMEAMAARSVDGAVKLDYATSGLTWRLTCPSANALGSPPSAPPQSGEGRDGAIVGEQEDDRTGAAIRRSGRKDDPSLSSPERGSLRARSSAQLRDR